jgi:hypothetical protein
MACWFKLDVLPSVSGNESDFIGLSKSSSPHSWMFMGIDQDAPNADKMMLNVRGSASNPLWTSTSAVTGTWQHACGVSHSPTDHRVFLDGGGKGTDAVSQTLSTNTVDRTTIGGFWTTDWYNKMDGQIAEACIWNIGLSDEEIAALARGVHPLNMHRASIVGYWPLFGNDSPEPDLSGNGLGMTVTGATKDDHCPCAPYYRRGTYGEFDAAVAAGNAPTGALYGPLVGPLGGPV